MKQYEIKVKQNGFESQQYFAENLDSNHDAKKIGFGLDTS